MNTDLEKLSTDLSTRATGLIVKDQSSADAATELLLAGKDAIKKILAFFKPMKQAADEAKRQVLEKEKAELAKIEPVVNRLSASITAWRIEEDRKRREAEAAAYRAEQERIRLEAEAMRKVKEAEEAAERDRLRLEREAEELARKEREALAAGDKDALAAAEEKREEIRQEAQAALDTVERATDAAIDEAAKAEAAMAPPPVVPETPRTSGLAMRDNWCFEVVDDRAVPREYLSVDEVKIGVVVRGLKGKVQIPGVRIFNKPTMAQVGRRNGSSLN